MLDDQKKIINKDKRKIIFTNVCPKCKKKMIFSIQCLECKNYFCKKCIEYWKNKNRINSCPFKCLNPSFEIINIFKFNRYNKEKYLENICLLKRYKELEIKLNINENNSKHLTNCFKSIYHSHYLYNSVSKHFGWICDICEKKFEIKTKGRYRCKKCDFDICSKCRILEESGYIFNNIFLSKSHEHLLRDETFKETNWICDVCDKRYEMKTIKRYRCENCDYDICYSCKIKEIKNTNGYIYNFLISIFNCIFIIYLLLLSK